MFDRAWQVLLRWRGEGLERTHERVPLQVTSGGQRAPPIRYDLVYFDLAVNCRDYN